MKKDEYFASLEKMLETPLYLAQNRDELLQEPLKNEHEIRIPPELAGLCHAFEFFNLVQKIILRRHYQLIEAELQMVMVFYAWLDIKRNSLKFSLMTKDRSGQYPFRGLAVENVELNQLINTWLEEQESEKTAMKKPLPLYFVDLPLENT